MLAWILSCVMSASVKLEGAGCNSLRDVTFKFRKGSIDNVFISKVNLTLGRSLIKLGTNSIHSRLKLQLLVCDIVVVMNKSEPNIKKKRTVDSYPRRKGKLMLTIANISRFLSVSLKDIVVKFPNMTVEVKELKSDIHKDSGADPFFNICLQLTPFLVQMGILESSTSLGSDHHQTEFSFAKNVCASILEKNPALIMFEDISITCKFGYERERLNVKALDLSTGDITVDLNESLFLRTQKNSESSSVAGFIDGAVQDNFKKSKKKFPLESFKKGITVFPEKVSFSMAKIDVKFTHTEYGHSFHNCILGVNLSGIRSKSTEDVVEEDTSHIIFLLNFNEIYLLKGGEVYVIEILRLSVNASVDVPLQENTPIKVGANSKIGVTQCNLILSELSPLLKLYSSRTKEMILNQETSFQERSKASERKGIMWTCAVSAPEFTILVYSFNDLPLYRGYYQSCVFSVNNIATNEIEVHVELSELSFVMDDGSKPPMIQKLLGEEKSSGSLLNIKRLNIDWVSQDIQSHERDNSLNWKQTLSVDLTGMGVFICLQQIETLISTLMFYRKRLKDSSLSSRKVAQNSLSSSCKTTVKRSPVMKMNIDCCIMTLYGDINVENAVVADPKRVNFGSQGGEAIINESSDGTTRTATILSNIPVDCNHAKFKTSVEVVCLSLYTNKDKELTQIGLERAKSIYQDFIEDEKEGHKITIFDLQKTKFVRRANGKADSIRSLFSAVYIAFRWEPDAHLALYEFAMRVKFIVQNKILADSASDIDELFFPMEGIVPDNVYMDTVHLEEKNHKRDSVFALDVEYLRISAKLADGVEAMIHANSIFSENAKIGVLLEGFMLCFNEARILKSGRLQLSSIPISTSISINENFQSLAMRNWTIQGLDVCFCLPYRLQLRAIDDAVEEMFRGLKLATFALHNAIFPIMKVGHRNKKSMTPKIGSLRVILHRLTADIEEEPMQGWLDEHYYLLKNEVCELNARLKFFDEVISSRRNVSECTESSGHCSEKWIFDNGLEINISDITSVQLLQEEIYRQSFKSYHQACQKLVLSDGSGACFNGFQSGFKPSKVRDSLLSISAIDLDVNLTKIKGGIHGMIEFIKKVDPFCLENDIPFSRLYGTELAFNIRSIVVQLRNYSFPIFSGNSGNCHGHIVLAQQATCYQPQVQEDVFVGKWRRVRMFRSVSGTTPAMKTYLDLPISFHKGEISYGVGYEPVFADVSYAFTVALRRAKLGLMNSNPNLNVLQAIPPPKKERALPWWDDIRYYIHGKQGLFFSNFEANILATSDPYEKHEKVQIISQEMDMKQTDGLVKFSSKDFRIFISSMHGLLKNSMLKIPCGTPFPLLTCPSFSVDVVMDWECESGSPLNHYLHALPNEGIPRQRVYDSFRSLCLSLQLNFSLGVLEPPYYQNASKTTGDSSREIDSIEFSEKVESILVDSPTFILGVHDLVWLLKWWNLVYLPPQKLRSFSRWLRFGVPRVIRSGNLSLDKVMTEFFLRIDSTPTSIKYFPLRDEDPAKGLTFIIEKQKCELCWSRGKQKYTFDCKRDILDLVYHGFDLLSLNVYLHRDVLQSIQTINSVSQSAEEAKNNHEKQNFVCKLGKKHDSEFLLYINYFTLRRQTPKADCSRLLAWQAAGRKNLEIAQLKYKEGNNSDSDDARSDPSDDDEFNVVIADSCQRIFVYGLKLLWTLKNRDAICSLAAGLSKIFEPTKPSPSHQYAQRKMHEQLKELDKSEVLNDATIISSTPMGITDLSTQVIENQGRLSAPPPIMQDDCKPAKLVENYEQSNGTEEEGTRNFMVNVVQPQFNLQSEDAKGRFLLAAVSGCVLARSFHSVLHLGCDVIEKAPETVPEMTWKRVELSVMLEHVQAHVAPTDVDPGAGIQWLPKIHRSCQKVKRTGALLERVFMPCQMYFRYTRHRSIETGFKVKPLKELSFNSPNIMTTMTSHQFQVLLDVLSSLLFVRLPKMDKNCLSYPSEDDDDIEEEADVIIPKGFNEVELASVKLEQIKRERKLLLDDIRLLSASGNISCDPFIHQGIDGDLWLTIGEKPKLLQRLKLELDNNEKSRKTTSSELRVALRKASQLSSMEKEKNKSPSYAMRISMRISKVVWSMIEEGKPFAEVEINDLAYDFDRDFKDTGLARFTIKSFTVKNGLLNAKSDKLLSAWNAPSEWGKNFMLRVDAKQGAPKNGSSPIELFQVVIYPLKIQLTETMWMIWHYFLPEDEQNNQLRRRQEAWKVSTAVGLKRGKKSGANSEEAAAPPIHHLEAYERSNAVAAKVVKSENSRNLKKAKGGGGELRRTSPLGKTWDGSIIAQSAANDLAVAISGPARFPPRRRRQLLAADDGRRALTEFRNVRISQVELLLGYEGSRFPIGGDWRLLMDTFQREEFVGTWGRLFSRIKKHVIISVLKSVAGMQGKKFKGKSNGARQTKEEEEGGDPNHGDGGGGEMEEGVLLLQQLLKSHAEEGGAGEGFVRSIRGLFNSQRRRAKALVRRTMRGAQGYPFARQLTIHDKTTFSEEASSSYSKEGPHPIGHHQVVNDDDYNDDDDYYSTDASSFEDDVRD